MKALPSLDRQQKKNCFEYAINKMAKFLQNWDSVGISRIIDEIERNHGRNQAEVVGFSSFGGSNGCSSYPSWASASIGTSCLYSKKDLEGFLLCNVPMYSFGHMPNEMFKDVLRHVFQCNDLLKTDFSLEEHVGKSIHHPFGEESEKKAFELKKKVQYIGTADLLGKLQIVSSQDNFKEGKFRFGKGEGSKCHTQFKDMKQDIYTKGIDSSSYYYLINYSLEIDEH
ncbi:hypothetical protein Anapl_06717 [Anas platyrhynchos]|uniref:Uncharacterized protein n=1 Tax=Anas platyrhynchos TaxID=8839 RepID=R0LY67_ANAPL|nr:hypothetical protein Anapl_06717 [Anas platyrhynchos]